MDGNGRWARERGLPRTEGHREGALAVQRICAACGEQGVDFLTLFAFSSENWSRPQTEVNALMALLEEFLVGQREELMQRNIRLRAIGRIADLPASCQEQLAQSIELTRHNSGLTLVLALSYGGREEIVDATRRLMQKAASGQCSPAELNNALFAQHLDTADLPDPDLLIRSSGELRLSNFLLWQLSYTEFYISPVLWPDFEESHLREAIAAYSQRQRRFGAVPEG